MALLTDVRDRLKRRRPDDRGFALIAILFLTMVITLLGLAFYQVAGYEVNRAQYQRDYAQAFWAAETGLDRTMVHMKNRKQPPWEVLKLYENEAVGNGAYDVEILPDPDNTTKVEKLFTLRSTGRSGRAVRVLEEVVQMEGFQRYGYFTNQEIGSSGKPIWFVTGDDVGGKTHTNGIFHISGSPQFRGAVTTASSYMVGNPDIKVYGPGGWPAGANNPVFHEGLTLGVDQIELPADTGDLRDAALDGGLDLTGDYELQLGRANQPGILSYRPQSGGDWSDVPISSLGSGVVHVTGNAQLSGVLDGELTVGASGQIEIVGNIRYVTAHHSTGRPRSGSDDILGIVAGKDVVVRDIPATRGNVIIDATIMALGTSFKAENFDTGTPRGTLQIWGGLIQDRRGSVGYFRGSTLTSGYIKDYHYDERMSIKPPPEFPLTGKYSRVSWKEMAPPS
jgi:hypothetical protein